MVTSENYNNLKDEISYTWLQPSVQDLHQALRELADFYHLIIPARQIYNCQNVSDAFNLLQKRKILSKERLYVILELSRLLGGPTEMIKSRIESINPYYSQSPACICQQNQRTNNMQQDYNDVSLVHQPSKYAGVYDYLSDNLGDRWIDLAKKLPNMRHRAQEIKEDLRISRQKHKTIQVLEEFESKFPGNTLQVLLNTLRKCEMNKQHDYIIANFSWLL